MSYKSNTDNIYPEGTLITAKADPSVQLRIVKYYQRTYYCTVVGEEGKKQLAYFEKELIPPKKGS
jgi:hypothetical protein